MYPTKLENLKEMGEFLNSPNLPRVNQEELGLTRIVTRYDSLFRPSSDLWGTRAGFRAADWLAVCQPDTR